MYFCGFIYITYNLEKITREKWAIWAADQMGSGLWFEPVRHNILHINLIFVMYPAGWDPKVIEMYSDVSGFFKKEKLRVSFMRK